MNIFRIHQGINNELKGWDRSNYIDGNLISTIPDTLYGLTVLHKMGTSIPSPFARMFLFDAAFKMIQQHDGNSPYHLLVSECLDLIEFLYLRSNDKLLDIKKWDKTNELNYLRSSVIKEHQQLADTLENHLQTVMPGVNEIYLFYYDGVLIGGTSPFTLVFTSPNWQRKNRHQFSGGIAGQSLFTNTAYPLHKRSTDFREYMQKLRLTYNVEMSQQSKALYDYLMTSINIYDQQTKTKFATGNIAAYYNKQNFGNEYGNVTMADGTVITSCRLPIAHKNMGNILNNFQSGYMIRPTRQHFANYTANGVPIHLQTPLALTDSGLPNVTYLGGQPWDTHTCLIQRFPAQPLHQRILPGGSGISYPYLTDSDFLQDKIIKVPYTIASDNFVTCFNGDSNYLLPIKKEYFNFFSIADLEQNMSIRNEQGAITVTLQIPISDATYPYINFKKKYVGNDIIEGNTTNKYFNIGCTPFYKVTDLSSLNNYCILLGDTTGNVKLDFYSYDSVNTEISPTDKIQSKSTISCQYIHIKSFDLMQLDYEGNKALIIPKMQKIDTANAYQNFLYCVDFGTTNTHIAYSTDNGATCSPFSITKEDMQVTFLNKLNLSNGNAGADYWESFQSASFAACADREFMPTIIGEEKASVSYPYRTVVRETTGFEKASKVNLFGNISIGYLMMRELSKIKDIEYRTDLKWALENHPQNITACENRVKAYCRQIIWMIKNKTLLNEGKPTFRLVLTFPGTMNVKTKEKYLSFWKDACDQLLPNIVIKLITESESVVPYYSFLKNAINNVSDAVNVDIGGGTMDMLFIQNVGGKQQYYTSTLFAANDLWGDGLSKVAFAPKDNGYIKLIDDALKGNRLNISQPNLINYYNTYKDIAQTSADIISFIFKNEKEFNISTLIVESKTRLYPLIFIYFAAIMYHITQVLKEIGMGLPTYLTFTGMGSKLIKLIAENENDIRDLAKLLLETFSNEKVPNLFKITFAANPKEITAEGGLASQHPDIDAINPQLIKVYGFDEAKTNYTFGETYDLKDYVLKSFNRFIDVFTSSIEIKNWLFEKYDVKITHDIIDKLKTYADKSYDMMAKRAIDPDTPVNETLFFWPLKQTLYELTKKN